jgi:tetratricopeptide (TPR) repeat protein
MWKPARLLIVILILSLAAVAQARTPQALVQDAIGKQQAGDLQGAVTEYREFLKLHPEATVVHSNLGAALAGLGRFGEAVSEYKIAIKQAPTMPGVGLNLALAYYKMGRIADAATELAKVRRESPGNSQATLLLADCYLRMGQNKDVIRVLQPAEDSHPDDLAIAYLLGTALIRDQQVEKGQVLVDRILRNGESAVTHLMLGDAKLNASDFAGARDELAKAVALDPKLPEVHGLYAQALRVTGDPDQALQEFQAELAIDPYDFHCNLFMGAMLREQAQLEEARPYLTRALAIRPGDLGARYQIAALTLSEGKFDEARRELEAIVKDAPQFTEAHVSLSLTYYRLKRMSDGDREREIVQKLTAEAQARQPASKAPPRDASHKSAAND